MLYSVLGFNQEEAVNANLNLIDLEILNYIIQANGIDGMKCITDENEKSYVWLSHKKILEDLPILGITEGTLRNKLNTLKADGWLVSISVGQGHGRGSRTYYATTKKCNELRYNFNTNKDEESRCHSGVTSKSVRCHSGVTPDNILNKDNILKDTISKDIVSEDTTNNTDVDISENNTTKKKKSRYEQFIDKIEEFTNDTELKNLLEEHVRLCLEMKTDKPLYANQYKGILRKLSELSKDIIVQRKIVEQSIEGGWLSFYELKQNKHYSDKPNKGLQMTEKDATAFKDGKEAKEYTDNLIKENERRGRRAVF